MAEVSVPMGSLEVSPPLFLAPMAGLTHSALRALIAGFGGVGLLSTEMLSAKSLCMENSCVSPYLIKTERETPMSYQLLTGQPGEIPFALARLEDLGAAAVDLNLGCGAPKVRRTGCGIVLWNDEARLKAVVREIRRDTNLPFTAKIRLGPELSRTEFRRRLLLLEDLGLDALYIHARLDGEPFSRRPRWEWAGLAKKWVIIPVIINGGICGAGDAAKCLAMSGADGLMIGRAAVVRPWIFSEIASEIYKVDLPPAIIDLPGLYWAFWGGLVSRFPGERQLGRLKEFTHYFARNYPFGNRLAMAVQRAGTMEQAREEAILFFDKNQGMERIFTCY